MGKLAVALMLAGAGFALLPAAASAAPRRHARVVRVVRHVPAAPVDEAPPLTVRPRSYLDPGDVVPEGSLNQYVWVPSRPHNDLFETGGLAWTYGAGTLPGPFTAPGRPVNLLEYDSDYGPTDSGY